MHHVCSHTPGVHTHKHQPCKSSESCSHKAPSHGHQCQTYEQPELFDRDKCLSPEEHQQYEKLLDLALEARKGAYSPNSGFCVGAALLAKDGRVFTASNKELTNIADHAETRAMNQALDEGVSPKDFVAIAVSGAKREKAEDVDEKGYTAPCGNCRQAIFEISPEIHTVGFDENDGMQVYRVGDEYPKAYFREKPEPKNPAPTPHNDPLVAKAILARSRSWAPRSNEPVGAAIETDKGIFTGTRAEVSSFPSTSIRMAIGDALEAGATDFKRLAVVGGTEEGELEMPKQMAWDCFQALHQLAPDADVLLPNADGEIEEHVVSDFPHFLAARERA